MGRLLNLEDTPINTLYYLIESGYRNLEGNFYDWGYSNAPLSSADHSGLSSHDLYPRKALHGVWVAIRSENRTFEKLQSDIEYFEVCANNFFNETPKVLEMYENALLIFLKSQNLVLSLLLSDENQWESTKNKTIAQLAQLFPCFTSNKVLNGSLRYSQNLSNLISTIARIESAPPLSIKQKGNVSTLIRFDELYASLLGNKGEDQYKAPKLKEGAVKALLKRVEGVPTQLNGIFSKKKTFDANLLKKIADDFYNEIHKERHVLERDLRRYCILRNTMYGIVSNISLDLMDVDSPKSPFKALRSELTLLLSEDETDKKALKYRKKMHINRVAKYLVNDQKFLDLIFCEPKTAA